MRYTRSLIVTRKNIGHNIEIKSHELSLRAGLVHQIGAGLYDLLPIGWKVVRNIETIIRNELDHLGALELSLPIVQPLELWKTSGRYDTYGEEMIRFVNREKREMCLGPTHEEVISKCIGDLLTSHKQLPLLVYQIGRKYRDEKRPRHGLLRCREFIMNDAYSFDINSAGMEKSFCELRSAYCRIFRQLSLNFVSVTANSGEIGGSNSEEFLAYSDIGEDKFFFDKNQTPIKYEGGTYFDHPLHKGIELGHIFQLGQKYSKELNVTFTDSRGKQDYPYMGCYGIGVTRIIPTIIEQNHDEKGIIWPMDLAPYKVLIIPVNNSGDVLDAAEKLYYELIDSQIDSLLDDRDVSPGVKFADADLLGIPLRVIVSSKGILENEWEVETRKEREKIFSTREALPKLIQKRLQMKSKFN